MMEHWIKQYHQIGYQLYVAYPKFAAEIWSTIERRASNHQVKMCQQQIEAKYVGSRKRKATQLIEEMHMKQEKRDQALIDTCSSLGTNESEVVEQKIEDLLLVKDVKELAELGLQLLDEDNSASA
jgi:hypothetical protein